MRPVSGPPQSSETVEPRAKQPRLGTRVYPTPLPMPILPTPLSRRTNGTVQQVVETAEDPEEKEEERRKRKWCLGQPCRLGYDLKAVFLLVPDERFIHPPQNGPLPRVVGSSQKGNKVETDMLILDKHALVPFSLEESALVPKERIFHSRMVDDDGNRFVKARLTARGDHNPELLTSAPTVSTDGKVVTLQVVASLRRHRSILGISGIASTRG